MMQERNIISAATAAVISPLVEFYGHLLPFLLLALVLIFVDSRFGIRAARVRGEKIRPSRKWRRAINKLVDYICWVTLAGMMGQTFGEVLGIPILSMLTLTIVYGIEITSCFNNYFEYKGINKKFNLFKFLKQPTLGGCFEALEQEEQEEIERERAEREKKEKREDRDIDNQ